MDAQNCSLQEHHVDSTPVEAIHVNPMMEGIMKELADLRKINQKLSQRFDNVLHPKAKKAHICQCQLFGKYNL